MNDLQKIFIVLGILLFVVMGMLMLFLLFTGFVVYGDTIAVIDLKGEITNGGMPFDAAVSADLMRVMFADAAEDPSVVGVVLYIDSPGGGVVETKEIARALSSLAAEKPVIAYIGDVGASGAYYVATFADAIVADEDSMVGSVGVISSHMIYKNLLEEKLGINTTVIKSGDLKDMGSPYRQMTNEEIAILQQMVDIIHDEFLEVVVYNRGLSEESIAIVEESGLFLGSQALDIGLIDMTGGLMDAVELAKTYAASPDAEVYYMDPLDYYGDDIYYSMGRGMGDSLASAVDMSDDPFKLV